MQTQTLASEVLCCLTLSSAAFLAVWELTAQRRATQEEQWLITKKRLHRRMAMVSGLIAIGIVMLLEIMGSIDIHNLRALVFYVSVIGFGSLILCVLALADGLEIAKNLHEMEVRKFRDEYDSHSDDEAGGLPK